MKSYEKYCKRVAIVAVVSILLVGMASGVSAAETEADLSPTNAEVEPSGNYITVPGVAEDESPVLEPAPGIGPPQPGEPIIRKYEMSGEKYIRTVIHVIRFYLTLSWKVRFLLFLVCLTW